MDIRANRPGVFVAGMADEGAEVAIGAELYKLGYGVGKKAAAVPAAAAPKAAAAAPKPASAAAAPKPAAAAPKPASAAAAAAPSAAKAVVGDRSETRVKMTRMRSRISQRLKESQNTAAMLTTFQVSTGQYSAVHCGARVI